jgi:hypothetical protein
MTVVTHEMEVSNYIKQYTVSEFADVCILMVLHESEIQLHHFLKNKALSCNDVDVAQNRDVTKM